MHIAGANKASIMLCQKRLGAQNLLRFLFYNLLKWSTMSSEKSWPSIMALNGYIYRKIVFFIIMLIISNN